MPQIPYRLGVDLGSNSLGWAVLQLDGDGRPDYLGLGRLGFAMLINCGVSCA